MWRQCHVCCCLMPESDHSSISVSLSEKGSHKTVVVSVFLLNEGYAETRTGLAAFYYLADDCGRLRAVMIEEKRRGNKCHYCNSVSTLITWHILCCWLVSHTFKTRHCFSILKSKMNSLTHLVFLESFVWFYVCGIYSKNISQHLFTVLFFFTICCITVFYIKQAILGQTNSSDV